MGVFEEFRIRLEAEAGVVLRDQAERPRWRRGPRRGAGWCSERHNDLYAAILRVVATHRVNNRPDRVEPRAVKRRPKKQVFLNEPRPLAIARLLKGR